MGQLKDGRSERATAGPWAVEHLPPTGLSATVVLGTPLAVAVLDGKTAMPVSMHDSSVTLLRNYQMSIKSTPRKQAVEPPATELPSKRKQEAFDSPASPEVDCRQHVIYQ
ncbi:hypothetical protein CSOJ01_14391 [Colletotrichum sojae]|uniref:Uncharacterized protein n=1 Tax=Colletotrichum sojae TaxID=2175907 RepID=A0A8H6IQM3_9PEZI|nr:hypothetical protein CSOJ01_14391 [Colletotrichum sojae]